MSKHRAIAGQRVPACSRAGIRAEQILHPDAKFTSPVADRRQESRETAARRTGREAVHPQQIQRFGNGTPLALSAATGAGVRRRVGVIGMFVHVSGPPRIGFNLHYG